MFSGPLPKVLVDLVRTMKLANKGQPGPGKKSVLGPSYRSQSKSYPHGSKGEAERRMRQGVKTWKPGDPL